MDEAGCYFLRVCWLMVKVVCLLNKGKKGIKERQRHRKLCNGGNYCCQRHGSLQRENNIVISTLMLWGVMNKMMLNPLMICILV